MKNDQRQLIPVRNNPGIYKIFQTDPQTKKVIDSGRFLASRRSVKDGRTVREKGVFANLLEAKEFRSGNLEKKSSGANVHRLAPTTSSDCVTFGKVVERWKAFHFLTLKRGSRRFYENKLPYLDFFNDRDIERIDRAAVDDLVKFWTHELPRGKQRECFDRELDVLKVVLNFYKSRHNSRFEVQVEKSHYQAATIVKRVKDEVSAFSEDELAKFLHALKKMKNPTYYLLALTQFALGLRIGEACGLAWSNLDLDNGIAYIRQTVTWDDRTWESFVDAGTKNSRCRTLAMPHLLVDELRLVKAQCAPGVDLVFHKRGQPLIRKTIAAAYTRILEKIGLSHLSGTHIVRKSAATQANDATGDFFAVSQLLGHSSPTVTQRYVKKLPSHKLKVASALNDVLQRTLYSEGENLHVAPLQSCDDFMQNMQSA